MHRSIPVISRIIAVTLILVLTAGIASAAVVTGNISVTGNLTNAAGTPLTGTYSVTFRLYNAASGGRALATDTHSVTAARGQYQTTLGFPPGSFNGQGLWIGIQRSPDPEKTPRTALYPAAYALSLRPGAVVTGNTPQWALRIQNSGGTGLLAVTSNDNHPGVLVNTSGQHSSGFHAEVHGDYSPGMSAVVDGAHSGGVHVETSGDNSAGFSARTEGMFSPGLYSESYGDMSGGISVLTSGFSSFGGYAETRGMQSPGLLANTSGNQSAGLHATTRGNYSPGLSAQTNGTYSPGVIVTTSNTSSPGVMAVTSGAGSAGINAESRGARADAVHAYSRSFNGIFAQTGNASHLYGVYTPDRMSALGYDTNSGDVAEYFGVSGEVTPGTVLVIGAGGVLVPSSSEYDPRVAGIVSTRPGVSLGVTGSGNPGEALVAVAGKVPCRVTASNGAIREGDLLSTSSRPGFAMKAADPKIGTVLGKALGTLESGTGTIEVLVTLQ